MSRAVCSPNKKRLDFVFNSAGSRPVRFMLVLVLTGLVHVASSSGQELTPHEESPGAKTQPYDYFNPVQLGSFEVLISPTDIWEQVTPAAVAGCKRAGMIPILPGAQAPDEYVAPILMDLCQRHFLDAVLCGDTRWISHSLVEWFVQHGARSVRTVQVGDFFDRSVALAEQELSAPRCVVFTTFNLVASHLAAVGQGPAFALRHETTLPRQYRDYLDRHSPTIERVYIVDVAKQISPSQSAYHGYGNLTVPDTIEEALKLTGIPVKRITGPYEEDVSVMLAREIESLYAEAVREGIYQRLPMGWIPSSSLVSEWTNLGALIPFAMVKQWFVLEYWADIHLKGREDTVNAFSDRYVDDFFLGLACLRHDGMPEMVLARSPAEARIIGGQAPEHTAPCASCTTEQMSRRDRVICTFYRWLADYLFRTGIRDFILCESNGPYGENAAPIFNFEQVPGMILSSQMKGLYYRGWSGGGGLSGIDYDGSRAARKACAVTLLALERALYPPLPWQGTVMDAWPPEDIDHWEEAPRAICLTSDYEGWYANVFITPRLIAFAREKGVKFTLRPQGDISIGIPDYLRRYAIEGRGVIEFSHQGFLHEFNLLPYFSTYDHAGIVTNAVDRLQRYAGIKMVGFMPAGGFITSPDLVGPARSLGLMYVFCPQGKYAAIFDQYFDVYSRLKAPETKVSIVSHFSERLGDLAYSTLEEDIAGNIEFVQTMINQYDAKPYAPYTAWHFAHGFQIPDDDALRVLEATVDYLIEKYVSTGQAVFATLADVAAYFEKGDPLFKTPVASIPETPETKPFLSKPNREACGACSHVAPGSRMSAGWNYAGECGLFLGSMCLFLGLRRRQSSFRRTSHGKKRGKEEASVQRRPPSCPLCWFLLVVCFLCGPMAVVGSGCSSDEGEGTTYEAIAFTVMTYNILFDIPDPDFDRWAVRKHFVADIIKAHDPDIVGLQEPFAFQVEDLVQLCPGYQAIALVNPPTPLTDTDATILFKETRFAKITQGSYWLSPTPDVPFSGGWGRGFGNFFPRMVIWALMVELETGMRFSLVNTHFDNTSPSQEKSAPLFLERTKLLADKGPVIATGDFNSTPSSLAYRILTTGYTEGESDGTHGNRFALTDSFDLAPGFEIRARSGDATDYDPDTRIDHVFVAGGNISCQRWIVDMTSYGPERKYPSDHFAVIAHLTFAGERHW